MFGKSMNRLTRPGRPFSPAVTLSPNAMNRVTSITTGVSVIENAQLAWRPCPSMTVHATGLCPIVKTAPDAGVHDTVSGTVPPRVVGAGNDTSRPPPEAPWTVMSPGQAIAGASGGGGITGLCPQPATSIAATTHAGTRVSTPDYSAPTPR